MTRERWQERRHISSISSSHYPPPSSHLRVVPVLPQHGCKQRDAARARHGRLDIGVARDILQRAARLMDDGRRLNVRSQHSDDRAHAARCSDGELVRLDVRAYVLQRAADGLDDALVLAVVCQRLHERGDDGAGGGGDGEARVGVRREVAQGRRRRLDDRRVPRVDAQCDRSEVDAARPHHHHLMGGEGAPACCLATASRGVRIRTGGTTSSCCTRTSRVGGGSNSAPRLSPPLCSCLCQWLHGQEARIESQKLYRTARGVADGGVGELRPQHDHE